LICGAESGKRKNTGRDQSKNRSLDIELSHVYINIARVTPSQINTRIISPLCSILHSSALQVSVYDERLNYNHSMNLLLSSL